MKNRFSARVRWEAAQNDLSTELARLRADGSQLIDLTNSNPTAVGLELPTELLGEFLAEASLVPYQPEPLGLRTAREAIAESLSRDEEVDAEDIVITASTSEAYSYLFKLLCDPGDSILAGTPSYPLLESLAALDAVELRTFDLQRDARWSIDLNSIAARRDERTRAIVVVHPNNPTGSYLSSEELRKLVETGLPLISDEVFFDFPVEQRGEFHSAAKTASGLVFSLSGISKGAALPHWKLGWIRVGGDEARRRNAVQALELIADSYLSVATPVQAALPQILEIAPEIRQLLRERLKRNLIALDALLLEAPAVTRLKVEGGWSVVLRVPSLHGDEDFAISLLRKESVLIQPGYFFDFRQDGYLVASLITAEKDFAEGMRRLIRHVGG